MYMTAKSSIEFEDKEYVLSKEAAAQTGYTQDYVGQLARNDEVLARRVGGLWYVNVDSLRDHKEEHQSPEEDEEDAEEEDNNKYNKSGPKVPQGALVMFDGKEYLSSKEAALQCGYTQDYVGQLLRSGKVQGRRIGASWYVLKSSLKGHRREKDSKLASVQASSLGVAKENKEVTKEDAPLLKYITSEDAGLPSLNKKSRDSEIDISESRNLGSDKESEIQDSLHKRDTEPLEIDSDFDEEHHIRVRAMQTDIARKETLQNQQDLSNSAPKAGKIVYRSVWDMPTGNKKVVTSQHRASKMRSAVVFVSILIITASVCAGSLLLLSQKGYLPSVKSYVQSAADFVLPGVEYKRD